MKKLIWKYRKNKEQYYAKHKPNTEKNSEKFEYRIDCIEGGFYLRISSKLELLNVFWFRSLDNAKMAAKIIYEDITDN